MKEKLLMLTLITLLFDGCNFNSDEGKDEILVYLSVRNKNYDIYKNDLKGTEKKLTNNPGFDYSPMWSERFEALFYYSYVNDSFLIASMDLDGKNLSLNTYDQPEFNLSPDGKKLIHQVSIRDFSALVLTTIEGDNPDTISSSTSYNGRAKWAPGSEKIAYISDRDGNNEIYLYDLKQKSTTRLTSNETYEKYITWSPTGDRIAYTTQYYEEGKPDRNDVFIKDLASGQVTQITNNTFNDTELAWSPVSEVIAFHSTREGQDHIFTMNSDGSNVQQITTVDAYHGEPEWVLK